jgi:hypothetical protein
MKIRLGYVGNSSSSSFIIRREYLSPYLIDKIERHKYSDFYAETCRHTDGGKDLSEGDKYIDAWSIYLDNDGIHGETIMDNFDMEYYLTVILGVPESLIEWESY